MKNKVTVEVETYDDDKPVTKPIKVHGHWNWHDRVVLEIGNEKVTVLARSLKAAIDSATLE